MRKGIELPKEIVATLQKLADADFRSLKSYMEKILIEHTKSVGKNNKTAPTKVKSKD
jgi:hypothetical protein